MYSFTVSDIINAAKSPSNRKTPHPILLMYPNLMFPNKVVKSTVSWDPELFKCVFNKCLVGDQFLVRWKSGKMVLLAKTGKPLDFPSALRSICLLDSCDKLLEKLIVTRLKKHLENINAIADNWYGFRRCRSYLDTVGRP